MEGSTDRFHSSRIVNLCSYVCLLCLLICQMKHLGSSTVLQGKWSINTLCVVFFPHRTSPRLLCVATQQKSTGQNLEEDQGQSHNEQKTEPSAAERMLTEEKAKLEEQLKEVTVSGSVCVHTSWAVYLRVLIIASQCIV